MKKILILIAMFFISLPSFSAGVGFINYEKVASEYTYAQITLKEITDKSREFEQYLKNKEVEFNKLETPLQKQKFQETMQIEVKAKEKAFNEFRNKKEEDVYRRIYAVAEKIRLEKNLDVLIDARGVFSGGIDITEPLIKRLNQVR